MADFVTVANLAASSLGEDDQLRSPDDDTHLSRSVRAVFDVERVAALRDHTWNFAMRRFALPRVANPDFETAPYGYAYRLPAECVRLVEVMGARTGSYQIEGPYILSGVAAPLRIRCIVDVAEPAEWDALFVKAFAMRVAWQIADRITGDTGRVQMAERKYRAALMEAKRVDARENPPISQAVTGWEEARMGERTRVDSRGFVWP
ncbi:MAG: hypothetical protein IIZ30_07305 [Sphingomonas sp.]|uniref:hypothetical protein n=1 Tax=Sphingomonas sp. TaxID=28214 RepID=UPI002580E013|nr:hypothetical protein [Sphingomonas sp.]MBQ1479827.1 hypothetical protein [Sphingomonas sp.]